MMRTPPYSPPWPRLPDRDLLREVGPGLVQLLAAYRLAHRLGREVWDFAVEIQSLKEAGLTTTDLRALVCRGYLEHAVEKTRTKPGPRTFSAAAPLSFAERSCFVLSAEGVAVAQSLAEGTAAGDPVEAGDRPAEESGKAKLPVWDAANRELWYAGHLVKRFLQPAPNQELLLAAFQEQRWPRRIDDPLPCPSGCDPRQRLHDAIVRLNRFQLVPAVRFRGDGTGEGVRWEPASPADLGG